MTETKVEPGTLREHSSENDDALWSICFEIDDPEEQPTGDQVVNWLRDIDRDFGTQTLDLLHIASTEPLNESLWDEVANRIVAQGYDVYNGDNIFEVYEAEHRGTYYVHLAVYDVTEDEATSEAGEQWNVESVTSEADEKRLVELELAARAFIDLQRRDAQVWGGRPVGVEEDLVINRIARALGQENVYEEEEG